MDEQPKSLDLLIKGLATISKAAIRLRTQKRFALDDYLLFTAAAFLAGTTGLAYYLCDAFYIAMVIKKEGPLAFSQLNPHQVDQVLDAALLQNIFLSLSWTATFFVKFSFLAFFKQMIFKVDRIHYYYWDVLTDILIVSIPITLLGRSTLRFSQKAGLGAFLCLSVVMISFALTRVSKISSVAGIDIVWEFFWQYLETAVAVIMGSLTVVRSLLVYQSKRGHVQAPTGARPLGESYYRRRYLYRRKKNIELESQEGLPSVPSATMTGMRTFIRRNNRDARFETQATGTLQSDECTLTGDNGWHRISEQTPSVDGGQSETLAGTHSQAQSTRNPYEGSSFASSRT
ncbi:hypothetical protein CHU98_g4656 [Xylaria longipes]|nr:hypothetical protein CHU98_g4656 [Xylaria longipes]